MTPLLVRLDAARHRIPFWWWLTYDALVGVVIAVGVSPSDPAFWLGFLVLGIAVVIDAVEFMVKRPSAVRRIEAHAFGFQPPDPTRNRVEASGVNGLGAVEGQQQDSGGR